MTIIRFDADFFSYKTRVYAYFNHQGTFCRTHNKKIKQITTEQSIVMVTIRMYSLDLTSCRGAAAPGESSRRCGSRRVITCACPKTKRNTTRGARTPDHTVKSRALCRELERRMEKKRELLFIYQNNFFDMQEMICQRRRPFRCRLPQVSQL
jgi:hypothetical protein